MLKGKFVGVMYFELKEKWVFTSFEGVMYFVFVDKITEMFLFYNGHLTSNVQFMNKILSLSFKTKLS